ncbi:hypothetical protein PHYSODRAFT_519962 [Phytophthora sojae]|uniref:Uncharacterized protein n=1 Tax=Phytophthora sojae (strain P6497) TaxID=1094619 RepID=G5A0M8_PHYSP|nr:hypothetical protein PHYSODRAFT_519962 [Phytophthora sojae]EGZ10564.1 hypothetical protein PHYSODRAFT_519962 [Phytophthora sojae]|eukprot:XP_009533309.1 hypothetical protein PHYSODRAFT_519962 [Phytophthora sojae]
MIKALERLWALWISVQVEFQGRYSVERLQQLEVYSKSLGTGRLLAILLLTPLPSLVISLLKEVPPLSPIHAGVFNNKTFFVRAWRANAALWNDVKRQLSVFYCQVALTFIYPIYIYGFVSLTGIHQVMFVMLLPVIQIIAKNWVSRQLTNHDLKPESVIFIVEVFNALYVSHALHNSSSWKTTATIMSIDFTHFWLSMLDVVQALDELKALMAKIPRGHPIAKENFVHVATRLVEIEYMLSPASKRSSPGGSKLSWRAQMEAWLSSRDMLSKGSTSRRDATELNSFVNPTAIIGLETIFSRQERAELIRKSARVLFVTEYIVLIEYAEVVLPIIYSLHEVILYHMHNRAYYPALAEMSTADLRSSVVNVLTYSSLEFLSLVMALIVLKRTVGLSILRQLAFVLETQASMVQSKLTTLFVYVMQVPLVHLGADFSFKFAWVHNRDS